MSLNNLIIISDLHAGSQLGLCPQVARLDNGGTYHGNKLQAALFREWRNFWDEWVPRTTHGEPFGVVVNGDACDGRHHNATDLVSSNLADQANIAHELLAPVVELCGGRFFLIRGTEAHTGPAAENEERLAIRLGAVKDTDGKAARDELWIEVGDGLVHLLHHIGTTSRQAYESTAVTAELADEYTEAGRNRRDPPDVIVRSHRHRYIEVRVPTAHGYGIAMTTPGWQGKTSFSFRIAGARLSTPQIGGCLVRQGDEELHTRAFCRTMPRPKPEVVQCASDSARK